MKNSCSVFLEPPKDFSPKLLVAGTYCEHEGKLLYLKRAQGRPEPHTWCIPGGKMEKGEEPRAAALREADEEIGVKIDGSSLQELGTLYVRLSHMDYTFYLFCARFTKAPLIKLAIQEHEEARWVVYEDALKLPLILGGKEALDYYYKYKGLNPVVR